MPRSFGGKSDIRIDQINLCGVEVFHDSLRRSPIAEVKINRPSGQILSVHQAREVSRVIGIEGSELVLLQESDCGFSTDATLKALDAAQRLDRTR